MFNFLSKFFNNQYLITFQNIDMHKKLLLLLAVLSYDGDF